MRLTINLATRRYLNLRRLNAWLIVGGLIALALLVFEVRECAYTQGDLQRIRAAQAARFAFANALIRRKTVNWLRLLDCLEEVVPNGVALSQIEPDQRDQLLKVSGVARGFDNLRALLENMEQSRNFSEVYLLSQSETKVGLTQKGITFAVTCKVTGP